MSMYGSGYTTMADARSTARYHYDDQLDDTRKLEKVANNTHAYWLKDGTKVIQHWSTPILEITKNTIKVVCPKDYLSVTTRKRLRRFGGVNVSKHWIATITAPCDWDKQVWILYKRDMTYHRVGASHEHVLHGWENTWPRVKWGVTLKSEKAAFSSYLRRLMKPRYWSWEKAIERNTPTIRRVMKDSGYQTEDIDQLLKVYSDKDMAQRAHHPYYKEIQRVMKKWINNTPDGRRLVGEWGGFNAIQSLETGL